jgi:hypothetical protein
MPGVFFRMAYHPFCAPPRCVLTVACLRAGAVRPCAIGSSPVLPGTHSRWW